VTTGDQAPDQYSGLYEQADIFRYNILVSAPPVSCMEQRELTETVVLGLLAEEAGDLRSIQNRHKHYFGRYRDASYGVLKPTISRLKKDGLVMFVNDANTSHQSVRANKSPGIGVYTPSEDGREYFRSLLQRPVTDVSDPNQQFHLRVKLGFLHHLTASKQDEELARLEDRFEQARERWVSIMQTHEREVDDQYGLRQNMPELTVRLLDDHLNWIKSSRHELKRKV